MMHPYRAYVEEYIRLMKEGSSLPLGGMTDSPASERKGPTVLIFSPHPDDECIIGALPLRLMRQCGMNVINVAVTQGSNRERQSARWEELSAACRFLGFGLVATRENGLERINPGTRQDDPEHWQKAVGIIRAILEEHRPGVVFCPHDDDWNSTHIGTHYLVMDALAAMGPEFECTVIETEFWGAMKDPNLMVESSKEDVADLMAAISFHVGEVERNPYHLRLPGWMEDNVRRGGELVGGQGGAAPTFVFSTLYRLRRWQNGRLGPGLENSCVLSVADDPAKLVE
jgi:LmbE family N-acetylglucosaminyl deacetylase